MLLIGTIIGTVPATTLRIEIATEIETEIEAGPVATTTVGTIATATVTVTATVTAACAMIDIHHRGAMRTTNLFLPDLRKPTVNFAVLTRAAAILSVHLKATSRFALKSLRV